MKAEKQQITGLLKTARGQMDGILKMVEEDRYCLDVSNQILAVQSILKKINREVIRAHMKQCLKEAFEKGNADEKIKELMAVMDKIEK